MPSKFHRRQAELKQKRQLVQPTLLAELGQAIEHVRVVITSYQHITTTSCKLVNRKAEEPSQASNKETCMAK
jgi:hypothetical protein